MKKPYLLLFVLLYSSLLFAGKHLHYKTTAPLYQHLVSINKEWKTQEHDFQRLLQVSVKFNSDIDRIQTHLLLVEMELRKRSIGELDEQTQQNRLQLLESLVSYYNNREFPINTEHDHRQPYFIDAYGTACAVGHLLQNSGNEQLANQISNEQNFAYIRELQYPELNAWAKENGFKTSELAWIQPNYYGYFKPFDSHPSSPIPKINVMKEIDGTIYVGGDGPGFTVYPLSSSGLPAAIVHGEVFDLIKDPNSGDFFIVGDIFNPNNPSEMGVAKFRPIPFGSTIWLNTGPTNGTIKKVVEYNCQIYIAGDFTQLNGVNMSYFATYTNGSWSQVPENCMDSTLTSLMVSGPINDMVIANDKIAIGGNFNSVNGNMPASGLAFYSDTGWTVPNAGNLALTSVDHLAIANFDYLLIGADNLLGYDLEDDAFLWNGCMSFNTSIPPNTGRVDAITGGLYHTVTYSKNGMVRSLYDDTFIAKSLAFKADSGSIIKSLLLTGYETFLAAGTFSNLELGDQPTLLPNSCSSYGGYDVPFPFPIESGAVYGFQRLISYPIDLASFEAVYEENNQIRLFWETHSEENSSHFEIERSLSGEEGSFEPIGKVNAAGTSTQLINYRFVDEQLPPSTYYYYRLKMIDLDNSFEYSDVKLVKVDRKHQLHLDVFPNPSNHELNLSIQFQTPGNVSVKLINMQGKLEETIKISNADQHLIRKIDISKLSSGLYIIQVINQTSNERYTSKFIKS